MTENSLPKGWINARIDEICSLVNGRAFKPTEWSNKGMPIIRIQNLNNLEAEFNYCDFEVPSKYYVDDGQLLFAWSGTPDTSFGAHIWHRGRGVLNQHIFKVMIDESAIDKTFLMYLFNRHISEYIGKAHGTAGLAHITKGKFDESIVPIPPLSEQHCIVAKIEELFTRLDAGVEALKKIQLQLKRYRQSVLKAAFSGELTAEWRQAHKGELEPASVLLEKIKAERKKSGKYKELPPLDTSALPELPEGWAYLTLDYLVSNDINAIKRGPFGSAIKKNYFVSSGYKVYEQGNVIYNDFARGTYFISAEKFEQMKGFAIRPGDILMSCSGTVGKIAIVPDGTQQGIINQALLKISLNNNVVVTPYFVYLLRSQIDEVLLKNTRGSAMLNISSVKDLRKLPLSIASLAEQQRVVEEIERHFSIGDEINKSIEQSLKQADRLRQSILKRAFEGRLVPQDPADEPAEKLLERIKAERAYLSRLPHPSNSGRTRNDKRKVAANG